MLLKFELKKLLKRKTSWLAVALSILAICMFYYFNYTVAQSIYDSTHSRIETFLLEYPEMITMLEEAFEEAQADENYPKEQLEIMEYQIINTKRSYEEYQLVVEGYRNEDWTKIYPYTAEVLERILSTIDPHLNTPFDIEGQPGSWFPLRVAYEEMQILLESGIPPFIQKEQLHRPFIATIYDNFEGKAVDPWKQITFRYGTYGLYFVYQIVQSFYIPLVLLIGCFIFGNTVSLEAGKKRRGLNFYAVLPVRKSKLFYAKFFSGYLLTLGFFVIMLIVPLLVSMFTKGIGSASYPVLVHEDRAYPERLDSLNDTFYFIELGEYLAKALLLSIFLSFFVYALYFFLSLFIKNPAVALSILGLLGVLGVFVLTEFAYNPLTYLDLHQVINGAFATLHLNEAINLGNGILTLFVFGLLFVILGYLRFNRAYVK